MWDITSPILEAEPLLAAHISDATLSRHIPACGSLADQVSRLSGLTKLTLRDWGSVLREAGMLDALRQPSVLQSLHCSGHILQTLLVNSVPSSWSTRLETTRQDLGLGRSHVEQQCPQLQALFMDKAMPLYLTALTSLTCYHWLPQDTDSFQCSRLGHLHVQNNHHPQSSFNLGLLPSTLTSLSCGQLKAHNQAQHLTGRQPLHICFTRPLEGLSSIRDLVQANERPVLATFVTSVIHTIQWKAFISPYMTRQHFNHLGAWCPHLQRVHIHLSGMVAEEETVISAAWLPAHCRLVVTHNLGQSVLGSVPLAACRFPCLHAPLMTEWTPCNVRCMPSNIKCTCASAA